MSHKMGIAIAAFAFAAASASSASADMTKVAQTSPATQTAPAEQTGQVVVQETTTYESERLPKGTVKAPFNAFEIQLDMGYAQGFGPRVSATGQGTKNELPSTNIGRAGMGAAIGLAYRATPNASVGMKGEYSMQDTSKGAQLRGAAASLDATYHANPYQRLDPFLSLGTGYRMLWDRPLGGAPATFSHGFELARAAIGVDVRLSKDIAIAPTIGGDVNMFLWRSAQGQATQTIQNPRVNTYLFAGVSGRFDLGGSRKGPPAYIGSR